jgi:hypothetical protein
MQEQRQDAHRGRISLDDEITPDKGSEPADPFMSTDKLDIMRGG